MLSRSEYHKQWREKNKEKKKQADREYREKNKEKIDNRVKLWKQANKEQDRAVAKERYQREKTRLAEQNKKYRQNNKEKLKEKAKQYKQANKERLSKKAYENKKARLKNDFLFKFKELLRCRQYKAVRGKLKASTTQALLGCTWEQARAYIEAQFKPGMSWELLGQIHIDHIRPLASFDLTDPEQQKQAFHYTNLQPLWAHENLSKGAKLLEALPSQPQAPTIPKPPGAYRW